MEKVTAIVLAAGAGKRMHSAVRKQYMLLCGKPVLYYSLRAFQDCPFVDEIVLVTGQDEIAYCQEQFVEQYGFSKVHAVVAGGKERYHSVYKGLKACPDAAYVFIHDGARPLVDQETLTRAYTAVQACDACVVGMPSKDTIKIADEEGNISSTPNRALVWTIQTPQVFSYPLVKKAYDMQMQQENALITDDAMVVENMLGTKIRLVEGSYENLKITTPEDIPVAEAILERKNVEKRVDKK